MSVYCSTSHLRPTGIDQNDHVWRWRNEQAGYHSFARMPWQEKLCRERYHFDINSLDLVKQARSNRIDDNREGWRNGDGPIY